MTKTITANIPARKMGKMEFQAYVETFYRNHDGRWQSADRGSTMLEADVIDICRRATNWPAIKAEHFPMFGFTR